MNNFINLLDDPYWQKKLEDKWVKEYIYVDGTMQIHHTPAVLCKEMIDKLKEFVNLKDKCILTINVEFIPLLLDAKELWFFSDNEEKIIYVEQWYPSVKTILGNFLEWEANMKFDVVVMNPPYQTKSEKSVKKTQAIWNKFVEKAILLTEEGVSGRQERPAGYLCVVHPGGWRNAAGQFKNVQKLILDRELMYLNINNYKKGIDTFGAKTDFDYYVLRNLLNANVKTEVVDIDDKIEYINLADVEFIPKSNIKEVFSLVAKADETKVDILFNSMYHHQLKHMQSTKDNVFKYPCIQNVNTKDELSCIWYSNTNQRGHFGIPKVIFGRKNGGVFIDENGLYGMAEDCGAIIDEKKNLSLIKKALKSECFIKKIMGFRESFGDRYNKKIIATFRKDFWKEFV